MFGTVANLIAAFREEENDMQQPYFWQTTLLVRYLNEGLHKFAKETMSFRDSTSDLCTMTLTAEQAGKEVTFDRRILTITRAFLDGKELELRADYPDDSSGTPYCLEISTADKWLRLRPKPSTGGVLKLHVIRSPLANLSQDDAITDVPDEHQHILMAWVKARAYLKNDAEVFNAEKAKRYEDEFNAECKRVYDEMLARHKASSNLTRYRW